MSTYEHARGSVWKQWDLHIHTPASFHWEGEKFNGDKQHDDALIDEMIHALNNAEPAVFAIMDYWTFDGWFKLKERLKDLEAPKLEKVIFPGIELRLKAPGLRLNAHAVFSDQIEDQLLKDFLSNLKIEIINRPLSNPALIELARKAGEDKLKIHGFTKEEVSCNDDYALKAGCTIAEINDESYKKAISSLGEKVIGLMPFDTNDGLSEVSWHDHYAYVLGLFNCSVVFESRKKETRDLFLGIKTDKNKAFFDNFQYTLNNIPRLVISGSDAHKFVGEKGNNNNRGYGDFPSNKKTWIKAETTFEGLKQAILEPINRSYIGDIPPKLLEVENNKSLYIDSIKVEKMGSKRDLGDWLNNCNVPLNFDLVAIIGNKGNGKSALADIIAMLGASRNPEYFNFLKKGRFIGARSEPANQFKGTLFWHDGSEVSKMLHERFEEHKFERVRYLPQGYFEELCNEHASNGQAFEKELNSVIFSHIPNDIRLGAYDFEQLVTSREEFLVTELSEVKNKLSKINDIIAQVEDQLQPINLDKLEDELRQKTKEMESLKEQKPGKLSPPVQEVNNSELEELNAINGEVERLKRSIELLESNSIELAKKKNKLETISNRLKMIRAYITTSEQEMKDILDSIGLDWANLVSIHIDFDSINQSINEIKQKQDEYKLEKVDLEKKITDKMNRKNILLNSLNAAQKLYEEYQQKYLDWSERIKKLQGSEGEPETILGLNAKINSVKQLPEKLQQLKQRRLELSGKIFDILDRQRKDRQILFKPTQDIIDQNKLLGEDYQLQFLSEFTTSAAEISSKLADFIQLRHGELREQGDGIQLINSLYDNLDINNRDSVCLFIDNIISSLENITGQGNNYRDISRLMKANKKPSDLYNFIYGLDFIRPRYSLLFQNTHIEQLSPGQRGALLLIFYLLVDNSNIPIILDQPEENLDNETVYRLLVPVLSEAKKRRQVIMVTHNPNLAVVCDAEQIIHAHFDRANNLKITYVSGAIENPNINEKVVTVLEGTKPAFSNRSSKYY